MGGAYEVEDDFKEVILPHLKKLSPLYSKKDKDEDIRLLYDRLIIGELTSKQFFKARGIEKPSLDFLVDMDLDESFKEFSHEIRKRFRLVILSNDCQEWADYRNERLGLNQFFDDYLTSSFLKAKKPYPEAYQNAVEHLKVSPSRCVIVDNIEENLHTPSKIGMCPILFARRGAISSKYPVISSFNELKAYLDGITIK